MEVTGQMAPMIDTTHMVSHLATGNGSSGAAPTDRSVLEVQSSTERRTTWPCGLQSPHSSCWPRPAHRRNPALKGLAGAPTAIATPSRRAVRVLRPERPPGQGRGRAPGPGPGVPSRTRWSWPGTLATRSPRPGSPSPKPRRPTCGWPSPRPRHPMRSAPSQSACSGSIRKPTV